MRRIIGWIVGAGITLNAVDLGSTLWALDHGAQELNPIVAQVIHLPAFWVAKLVIISLIFLYLGRMGNKNPWWFLYLCISVGIYVLVVANNLLGIIAALLGLY